MCRQSLEVIILRLTARPTRKQFLIKLESLLSVWKKYLKMKKILWNKGQIIQSQGMQERKKHFFLHNPWDLFTFASCQLRIGLMTKPSTHSRVKR